MPQNDSHIVEVDTWWCNGKSRSAGNKGNGRKFHSKSNGRKVGQLTQPVMQLKFLSNHRNIIVEWGDLKDDSSSIKPTLVNVKKDVNEQWTLKGRFIMKHDNLSHIKLHQTDDSKLDIFISKKPVFRWGEQTWNAKLNRNNRTTWKMDTPGNRSVSRWPLQFDAVEHCTSVSIIPKQKHRKKLKFLVDKLLKDESRLGTDSSNSVKSRKNKKGTNNSKKASSTSSSKKTTTGNSEKPNPNKEIYANMSPLSLLGVIVDANKKKRKQQDATLHGNDKTVKKKQRKSSSSSLKLTSSSSSSSLLLSPTSSLSPSSSTSSLITSLELHKNSNKSSPLNYDISPRTAAKSNNRNLFMAKKHTKRRNAEPSLSQLGLSKKEYWLLKSKNTREILSNMVEEASQLASKDWAGSGSSEQVGILIDFFKALEEPFQTVIHIGIEKSLAFELCHELLLTIAEAWNRLKNVPIPGGVVNTLLQQRKVAITLNFAKKTKTNKTVDSSSVSNININDYNNNNNIMNNNDSNNKNRVKKTLMPSKETFVNRIMFHASDGHVDFALKEIWGMLLISAANAVDQFGSAEVADELMFKFIKDVIDYIGHPNFDTGEFRNSRLGNLFTQRDKWEYLPTLHTGFSFDSPRGGPLKTIDDANDDVASNGKNHSKNKNKRGAGNNRRHPKTPPHFRLNPGLHNSRLGVQRSDSWDNFLGADDSPYK